MLSGEQDAGFLGVFAYGHANRYMAEYMFVFVTTGLPRCGVEKSEKKASYLKQYLKHSTKSRVTLSEILLADIVVSSCS